MGILKYQNAVYLFVIAALLCMLFYHYVGSKEEKRKQILQKTKLVTNKVRAKLYKKLEKRSGMVRRQLSTMDMRTRNKSKLYKYYSRMSVILTSLGISDVTNTETVFMLISVASIVGGIVLTWGIALPITIVVVVLLFLLLHAMLAFMAHTETYARVLATMDAEDLLSASMEDGIVIAIENNIESIDQRIRPVFSEFLVSVQSLNDSVESSMIRMNIALGQTMDSFCETSLSYYLTSDPILLKVFESNIRKNTKRRNLMIKQQLQYSTNMTYYWICMAVTAALAVMLATSLGGGMEFFFTTIGRTCLILSVCAGLVGFIVAQMIYSGEVS